MLDRLPSELLLSICDFLDLPSLKRLCEVSSYFHASCLPKLYGNLYVRVHEHLFANDKLRESIQKLKPFEPDHRLRHVRGLYILDGKDKPSCSCSGLWGAPPAKERNNTFALLCGMLPRDHLRSFSWETGFSLPEEVIFYIKTRQPNIESLSLVNEGGGFCKIYKPNYHGRNADTPLSLASVLKNVKRLRWRNLKSRESLLAVKLLLENNASHLESLDFGPMSWYEAWYNWGDGDKSGNFFATDLLGLAHGQTTVLFPSLRRLSLGALSFGTFHREIIHAFNCRQLRSLTIRNCHGMIPLVEALASSGPFPNLRRLELQWPTRFNLMRLRRKCLAVTAGLLSALDNLQDVFIETLEHPLTQLYWEALLKHIPTLERFVWSQSSFYDYRDDTLPTFSNLQRCRKNVQQIALAPLLQCMGMDGRNQVSPTEIPNRPDNARLLHYREARRTSREEGRSTSASPEPDTDTMESNEDYIEGYDDQNVDTSEASTPMDVVPESSDEDEDPDEESKYPHLKDPVKFWDSVSSLYSHRNGPSYKWETAQWAFGPRGPPRLQILVFGDYDRLKDNKLGQGGEAFRRARPGEPGPPRVKPDEDDEDPRPDWSRITFRELTESDIEEQELLRENADFIMACPVNQLVSQ